MINNIKQFFIAIKTIVSIQFTLLDKWLFWPFIFVFFLGMYSFISASLGLIERSERRFLAVLESQLLAYIIGIFIFIITISFFKKAWYYKSAIYIYILSLLFCVLVFIPGLGVNHGGALRWLDIGITTIQPSDFIKISIIMILSYIVHKYSNKLSELKYTSLYAGIIAIPCIILILQKDFGAIIVLFGIAGTIYFLDESRSLKYILSLFILLGIIGIIYMYLNPYAMQRFKTFTNSSYVNSNEKYQSEQAKIAVARGWIFGKGPLQGVQKYKYLPEPVGDSVFGTVAEEFGFVGSIAILLAYWIFVIRSIFLASKMKDIFAKMLIIGIVTHFIIQVILNIGSMLAIIPLSGDVLPLFSHGGTALIINLFEVAVILKFTKKKLREIK